MPTSGSQCSTEEHIAYGRKLAEFCAGLSLSRLPAEVVDKTKLCILDLIANIYGSLELDAVSRVVRYV